MGTPSSVQQSARVEKQSHTTDGISTHNLPHLAVLLCPPSLSQKTVIVTASVTVFLCSFSLESKYSNAVVFTQSVTKICWCCCVHPNCQSNLAVLLCLPQLSKESGSAVVFTPTVTNLALLLRSPQLQAWELSPKTQISAAVKIVRREKKSAVQKKRKHRF